MQIGITFLCLVTHFYKFHIVKFVVIINITHSNTHLLILKKKKKKKFICYFYKVPMITLITILICKFFVK